MSSSRSYLAALALTLGACSFGGGFDDTHYRCGDGDSCPTGQVCVSGYCEADPTAIDAGGVEDDGSNPPPDASEIPPDANEASADRCGEIALVSDTFSGAAVNTTLWNAWNDTGALTAQLSGALEIYFTGSSEAFAGYTSRYRYDLRESEWRAEIDPGTARTVLEIRSPSNQRLQFVIEDGELSAGIFGSGFPGFVATVPYDSVAHRHLRIREAGGTIYWESSSNGIAWTPQYSDPAPFPVDNIYGVLAASGVASVTPARFLSVNAGVDPGLGLCGTSTYADDFSASPMTTAFLVWTNAGCTITENGGDLILTYADQTSDAWCGAESSRLLDLTGDFVIADARVVPNALGFVAALAVYETLGSDSRLEIQVEDGTIMFLQIIDGSPVSTTSLTYSATTHRYWRIREAGGRAYFETSSDGSSWVQRHDDALEMDVTRVIPSVLGGHYEPVGAQTLRYGAVGAP